MKKYLFIILLALVMFGCTPNPEATQVEVVKKPIANDNRIKIQISGVEDDTLVEIKVHASTGNVAWGTRQGDGDWFFDLPKETSGTFEVVSEASGYISTPLSYTLQISGTSVYFVQNNKLVELGETRYLNFRFKPTDQ